MPSIKIVVLAIVAIVAGFFGMSAYLGTLPQLLQFIDVKAQPLATFAQQIHSKWTSLPSIVQQVVLMGIPTLFAIFFMWTKDRAMQKLQQTQQQATQLSSEVTAVQGQVTTLQQEKEQLTQKLQDNTVGQNLTEAQQLVTKQQQTISNQIKEIENLRQDVSNLAGQIEGLKTQIKYEKRIE